MAKAIYAIATMDSKGDEIAYVARCARAAGATVVLVDSGTKDAPTQKPDISRDVVASCHPKGKGAVLGQTDRGTAVTAMGEALAEFIKAEYAAGKVGGLIGIGGGGGTAMLSPALQALPVGVPKILVSTLPGGNVGPIVGFSDVTVMHSVVDVA